MCVALKVFDLHLLVLFLCTSNAIKAILHDLTRNEKFYFRFFPSLWNYPGYSAQTALCKMGKYSKYNISYSTLQYEVYHDPSKGKANSVTTKTYTTCSIFNLVFYCPILNVLFMWKICWAKLRMHLWANLQVLILL